MSWLLRYLRDATAAVNAMAASGSQHTAIRAMSHRPHPLQLRDEGREAFDAMNLDTRVMQFLPSRLRVKRKHLDRRKSNVLSQCRVCLAKGDRGMRKIAADLGVGVGTVQRVKT